MLNAGYKKESLRVCEEVNAQYKREYDATVKRCTDIHEYKVNAIHILQEVDTYIHLLSNKPKEIVTKATEISVRRLSFERELEILEMESEDAQKAGNRIAGGGVLAGAGVAAFGPSAAMGIATTFGSASTGTAIAALHGAAQTNAALAWLGGGALGSSAGAAGMAGGKALLAMAGPVGWAIGGAALVGGGLLTNSKNKKVAEKAEEQTRKVKAEIAKLDKIKAKITAEIKVIFPLNVGVQRNLDGLKRTGKSDYRMFTNDEKAALMELMNSAESLSKRIGVKIND